MRIRAQFSLVLLLLGVLPLAAIVLFSYWSSQRALRQAAEVEAAGLTREMESRMAAVRDDLAERVERVGFLPFDDTFDVHVRDEDGTRRRLVGHLLSELGDAAPYVESLEFKTLPRPEPPALAPAAPAAVKPSEAAAAMMVGGDGEASWVIDVAMMLSVAESELERQLDEIEDEAVDDLSAASARIAPGAAAATAEAFSQRARAAERVARSIAVRRERVRREEAGSGSAFQYRFELLDSGEVVGELEARIASGELLRGVLEHTRREQGEIPFAIDDAGRLYTLDEADRERIDGLDLAAGGVPGPARDRRGDLVVVTTRDATTGLTFGIARPIGESLAEIRAAAGRNFLVGAVLLLAALAATRPVSGRLTRSLRALSEGAERVAEGDLEVRVPVTSGGEIGQLARTFNRMTEQLAEHQEREIERKLLEADLARKSEELEEARRFQLSLLPSALPGHPAFDLAVHMETATEVGGDYYDFRLSRDGVLIAAVGDATGHGARAGTMVTVIKSLFSAFPAGGQLAGFLENAAEAIRRMDLGRMAMALTIVRLEDRRLTLSAAGMPPVLLHRRGRDEVEELVVQGPPLGRLAGRYDEVTVEVEAGDTLLLLSDGLVELPDTAGDPFGYTRVRQAFARAAAGSPDSVVAALAAAGRAWAGDGPPTDDVTFVVVRIR